MLKTTCIALTACFASSAAAQTTARPDPADPKAAAPTRPYESSFKDYRPYVDAEVARWRQSNDDMGRLGGHIGHVPRETGVATRPGAKPPARAGQGANK